MESDRATENSTEIVGSIVAAPMDLETEIVGSIGGGPMDLKFDHSAEESTNIIEFDAAESPGDVHTHTTQGDAGDIETSVSNEHILIDRQVEEDETLNAFTASQTVDETQHEPAHTPSSSASQEAADEIIVESNGRDFSVIFLLL